MDIFGYSFFVSFILAPLPGLLVSLLKRFNEQKASEWSLSFLIILDTILCALGLFQGFFINFGVSFKMDGPIRGTCEVLKVDGEACVEDREQPILPYTLSGLSSYISGTVYAA